MRGWVGLTEKATIERRPGGVSEPSGYLRQNRQTAQTASAKALGLVSEQILCFEEVAELARNETRGSGPG